MFSDRKLLVISVLCATLGWALPATAVELFTDDFDSGASELWSNDSGNWGALDGVYSASNPMNFPATYTSIPNEVTDFTFEVDINDVFDGGVWLRSTFDGAGPVGASGVLLITCASLAGPAPGMR